LFLSDLKELNQTTSCFMTQELDQNQCIYTNFSRGATLTFCLSFSGCW